MTYALTLIYNKKFPKHSNLKFSQIICNISKKLEISKHNNTYICLLKEQRDSNKIKREDNCMKNDQNNGQIIIKIDSPMAWKKLLHFYRHFFIISFAVPF